MPHVNVRHFVGTASEDRSIVPIMEEFAASCRSRHEPCFQGNIFLPANLNAELWPSILLPAQQPPYPQNRHDAIEVALTEAWAWLEAQGLIVPAPDINGRNGWRLLSRRAQRFASEAEFARYTVARMPPKEALHPRITERVWMAFMRGEFDVAAFQAMTAVEVSAREASGLGNNLIGVPLMREAL